MSKGLAYFEEVYDVVPDWVQKMHDYNPEILDYYTAIRSAIMSDGALTRKEKDLIIAVTNAARNYERSMLFHTKGAIDFGFSLEEITELFLVAYVQAGDITLKHIARGLQFANDLMGIKVEIPKDQLSIVQYFELFQSWLPQPNAILQQLIETTGNEEQIILSKNVVDVQLKLITMAGSYVVQLKGDEAAHWMEKARQAGVEEEKLAELGYISFLTAGIPSWFELSDSLVDRKKRGDES